MVYHKEHFKKNFAPLALPMNLRIWSPKFSFRCTRKIIVQQHISNKFSRRMLMSKISGLICSTRHFTPSWAKTKMVLISSTTALSSMKSLQQKASKPILISKHTWLSLFKNLRIWNHLEKNYLPPMNLTVITVVSPRSEIHSLLTFRVILIYRSQKKIFNK